MDICGYLVRRGLWANLMVILSLLFLASLTHGQPNIHIPIIPAASNQEQRQQQLNTYEQQRFNVQQQNNNLRFQQDQQQQQQQQIQGNQGNIPDLHGNHIQDVGQQQNGQTYKRVGNMIQSANEAPNVPNNVQQNVPIVGQENYAKVENNINSVNKVINNNQLDQDVSKYSVKDSVDAGGVVKDNVAAAADTNSQLRNSHNQRIGVPADNLRVEVPAGNPQQLANSNMDNQHLDDAIQNVKADTIGQEGVKGDTLAPKPIERNPGGDFDLAKVIKGQVPDDNLGNQNVNPLPVDVFDKKGTNDGYAQAGADANGKQQVAPGGLPKNIKVIDGDVEKNHKNPDQDDIGSEDEDNMEDDDLEDDDLEDEPETDVDNKDLNRVPDIETNEIPRNVEVPRDNIQNVNNMVGAGNINNNLPNKVVVPEQDKEGSLKVVWDWSDFAVNFEQYVMPEQKIRRAPHGSTGQPWPLPQYYVTKKDKVYTIDKASFRFKLSKVRCDIIDKALERYKLFILEDAIEDMYDNFQNAQSTMFEDPSLKYDTPLYMNAPALSLVSVKIRKPCTKYLDPKSDESYDLFVKRTGVHIWANEVWGALRGLETFSQLVFKGTNQMLYIRDTVINDYPRFSHRGIMIDSSRHFLFKETIYDVLEAMSYNKMNVLHWHLVDDQSFPFYSQVYPDLSAKGAFHPSFVYMPEDIADIIEFARVRGIRVEPEFDTPGHTYSWGLSRPDLLTQCYQGDRPVDGYLGPMDPSKNETFRFLKNFFKDVLHQFKDQYIHLGGDEVPMTCWQSNPEVMKFLAKLEGRPESNAQTNDNYYYSYDIRKVLEYYVNRLIVDIKSVSVKRSNGVRIVFWQEIMNNNVQLPNDTIIHVWQGGMEDVQRATGLGLNVLYSTCWYINLIEYGTKWSKYYQCDPADTTYGYVIDESKVLGGEACIWAEYLDNENLMSTLWPSASAAAERLWSSKDVKDFDAAAPRLQEHRCRMLSRGLTVGQISGPDYCLRRGKRRHLFNETASNCTQSQCSSHNDNSLVEVEKIQVEFEQKGARMLDCSQAVLQAGGQLTFVLLLLLVIAVGVTLKVTKPKMVQVRMCRNKTILTVFVTLILVYFLCYTSIWMQALEFKGSFEKRTSSNRS